MGDSCDVTCINREAVENVRSQMLSRQLVADTAEIFKVLADPTRVRLLYALAQREPCVCDLSAVLGMTLSAISHHLRDSAASADGKAFAKI
ncbi:MAG: ArsR/SmtB family transcription factor [Halobacteriota archaeon]